MVEDILSKSNKSNWFKIKFMSIDSSSEIERKNYEDWSNVKFVTEYKIRK